MNHYQIKYCDLAGKEVPVYAAKLYRVYSKGEHVKDFEYLSAANEWIAANTRRNV